MSVSTKDIGACKEAKHPPQHGIPHAIRWADTTTLCHQDRGRVPIQWRENRAVSNGATRGLTTEPVKENAPRWRRILTTTIQVVGLTIAPFVISVLVGVIEVGWIA